MGNAQIETNGADTQYRFEYAPQGSGAWTQFSSGASGTVAAGEDFADVEAKVTGLQPETAYCARVRASNVVNSKTEEVIITKSYGGGDGCFTTPSAKPALSMHEVRNVTADSAHLEGLVGPRGKETHWRFQYTTEPANASWVTVPGAEGTMSQADAEALPNGGAAVVDGSLTGLKASTTYYVRLSGENAAGSEVSAPESFQTSGPPSAATFAVHGLHGEALRIVGSVNPDSVPTSAEQTVSLEGAPTGGTFTLTFKGQTTAPIAFDAPAEDVGRALDALAATNGDVGVTGPAGGPYVVFFYSVDGGVAQPAIVGDGSGLTPSGSVAVTTDRVGGEGYDTHYHFEYVSQKQLEANGWAEAVRTVEEDLGSGASTEYVGADLPELTPGETYRFRLVATNTSPGNPVVRGEEQQLTVPVPVVAGGETGVGLCPNEGLRSGLSARLPDCRGYEQLTPVDKGGAQEIFNYGGSVGNEGASVGEDGDHVELAFGAVKWGSGPTSGQSPYFFSRGEGPHGEGVWKLTAAAVQPQAGLFVYKPFLLGSDLEQFAFTANWGTSDIHASHIEFMAGAPGGPYATAASVPSEQAKPGWVASSKDFSKLVLQVPDHALLGRSTHTHEGDDLYEYSKGELRQVNVSGPSPGTTIGSCGARIVRLGEGLPGIAAGRAVSADGARVFFEAAPSCPGPEHVYMRVHGGEQDAETVDLGTYKFVAANGDGTSVLLEKPSGEDPGLYLYTSASGKTEFLPSTGVAVGDQNEKFIVSDDFGTVYIKSGPPRSPDIYRYDIAARTLQFVTHIEVNNEFRYFAASPDGRYLYFIATAVAGLPAGGQRLEVPVPTSQVFRFDSAEALVQCISCASSFDPEPRLSAVYTRTDKEIAASANGDYVFFDTPAALVPSDVDGQVAPGDGSAEHPNKSSFYSTSSDVYEWRRDGVDGCSRPIGCIALITSGHGGFLNILLGTTPSGRDVFFATNESLQPADNDTASDIYDARIGGGPAEPSTPVECEGDACATPPAPPGETTPSSVTFQGAGNLLVSAAPVAAAATPKSKPKPKPLPRCRAKRGRKCKKTRTVRRARHAARHATASKGVHR